MPHAVAHLAGISQSSGKAVCPLQRSKRGQARWQQCRSSTDSGAHTRSYDHNLLDQFWEARGVHDSNSRLQLITAGCSYQGAAEAVQLHDGAQISGLRVFWQLSDVSGDPSTSGSEAQVAAITGRVLALQAMLGSREGLDLVWMLEREPRLLVANMNQMYLQLMSLREAVGPSGADVIKVVERQPSLLLQTPSAHSLSQDGVQQRSLAWKYGLMSDGEADWRHRLRQIKAYRDRHGDSHIGCREGDQQELARWAAKQRAAWRSGCLTPQRELTLRELDFELDEGEALWQRWFLELERRVQAGQTPEALPCGSADDYMLLNWCSVQRIAKRAGMLTTCRADQLDAVGFDWTGADALS